MTESKPSHDKSDHQFIVQLSWRSVVVGLSGCVNESENGTKDGTTPKDGIISQGKIAFQTSGGSIHLIDPTGKNEIRLGEGYGFLWSPDGKKILLPSHYTYEWSVISIDGTEINRTQFGGLNLSIIDWHPDGNKFLCLKYNYTGENPDLAGLCSIDINGNNLIYSLHYS